MCQSADASASVLTSVALINCFCYRSLIKKHLIGFRRDRREAVLLLAIKYWLMSAFGTKRTLRYRTCECPLLGVKRTWLFALQMSAFDPKRTFGLHCGNGFDASFGTYQCCRLSR